ncbi:hypothetical protein TNCV_3829281 [Trichonephila clavipes]|nr:hypothetical protein TNCV_3829281 [Trichonephila clavipes]
MMMIREHFGQQLHKTLFSVGVEVNNLGSLQAVDNDSKLRHKLSNNCLNGLPPPDIIDLHTDTEQRLVELLTKVLPDHHHLDIPRVRAFASFEPKDVSSYYWEQEASFKLCGLCMPNPTYTVWHIRLGNDMVPKT